MAYDLHLAERITRLFKDKRLETREMNMMGGLCYMLDEKMCVGIVKDQLMARVGPDNYEQCLAREGCSEMNFTGRAMTGYVYVNSEALDGDDELDFYVELAIGFNPLAKASKKKAKKPKE
ncbi:MAG: RNA methyltransferase [Bacteroidetes bacterium]|nr:MAG: RNA methyltransferase [Bacteroidota bacterium]